MKTLKFIIFGTMMILFIFSHSANAQEEILFLGEELGVGARAMSMGGAFVAVADDYSAIYWNPAGLGQIRRMELNLGFSHNQLENNTTIFGTEPQTDETSFTRLNSIGFVFPIPTYRGSLVFGFGYNKVRDFDHTIQYEGFNPNSAAYPDIVIPTWAEYGYTTAIDDSLYQKESLIEEGSLNQFSFSGAMEIQQNFYLGATINFISGKDNYSTQFEEEDIYNIYNAPFFEEDGIIADLDYWLYDQTIVSDISATNLKVGAMYKMGNAVRLGATVITPTKYKVKELWSEKIEEYYDWGAEEPFEESGEFEYEYETPYGFDFGASLKLVNLMLSGGIEFRDWSQAKFHTEPPIAGMTIGDINTVIKKDLTSTTKIRLGAELYLPVIKARLRAGYFNDPSPYKYATYRPEREYYTAGAGLMLDKQVMVDVGLVHGTWEVEETGGITAEKTLQEKTFDKIVGTLSIRF